MSFVNAEGTFPMSFVQNWVHLTAAVLQICFFFPLILQQRGSRSSAPCLLFCSKVCIKKSEYIKDAHLKLTPPPPSWRLCELHYERNQHVPLPLLIIFSALLWTRNQTSLSNIPFLVGLGGGGGPGWWDRNRFHHNYTKLYAHQFYADLKVEKSELRNISSQIQCYFLDITDYDAMQIFRCVFWRFRVRLSSRADYSGSLYGIFLRLVRSMTGSN